MSFRPPLQRGLDAATGHAVVANVAGSARATRLAAVGASAARAARRVRQLIDAGLALGAIVETAQHARTRGASDGIIQVVSPAALAVGTRADEMKIPAAARNLAAT